jgi:lipid A 3-O-deacylase
VKGALKKIVLFLALAGPALAAGDQPAPVETAPPASWGDLFRTRAFSLVSENDKYFAGTDRHYTNGMKLSLLGETRVDESPELLQQVVRFVPTLNDETARRQFYKVGVALGQNVYTPGDTTTTQPIPGDRPYAGWLYGSLIFQAQSDDSRLLRVVEITFGLVGPAALGEFFQNTWHDVIHVEHANGWANQLHNEPGLLLSWERRYRVGKIHLPLPGLQSDLIVRGGVSLGNIRTNLAAGFEVRAGWWLPPDFGYDLIRPAGGSLVSAYHFSLYFFGSGEVRAVARDIFLDGNTWRDSLSVDKRPVVADLNVGLALRLPLSGPRLKGLQIAYTQNYRTKDFYGQLQPDVFGSIGISLHF